MNHRYALTLAVLLPISLVAQTQSQNALDFDGVNDRVTVPNASALIANSSTISMTCWAYLRNPSAAMPNLDGIVGFRDNSVADFYFIQNNTTSIQARFRNSGGSTFTWTFPYALNTWQHYAMVYDGTQLVMYQDGVVQGSIPASGTIQTTTGVLTIGSLEVSGLDMFLDGKVDNVSLWNTALTASEVQCIMESGIDVSATGLQLYYGMDQGIAGGNNTGVTSLVDAVGNQNGTFNGMVLNGSTGNFVNGVALGTTLNGEICPGESYTFNGQALSQEGTYTASFPVAGSCDSLVTLILDVTNVNTNVVQQNGMLISQAVGAQYQWLDCGSGYAEIPGATNASYIPTTAGAFAVEVAANGCVDTSACYSNVGIEEVLALNTLAARYDAADDALVIAGAEMPSDVQATLFDAQGRSLKGWAMNADRAVVALNGLPAGVYVLEMRTTHGRRSFRVPVIR